MCDCIPTPSDVSIGGGSNFKVGGGGGGGGGCNIKPPPMFSKVSLWLSQMYVMYIL